MTHCKVIRVLKAENILYYRYQFKADKRFEVFFRRLYSDTNVEEMKEEFNKLKGHSPGAITVLSPNGKLMVCSCYSTSTSIQLKTIEKL